MVEGEKEDNFDLMLNSFAEEFAEYSNESLTDSSQDITVIERKNLTAERDNDPVETKTNNELSNDHIGNGSDENKNDKTELTNVHIKGKKKNQSLNAKDRESGERFAEEFAESSNDSLTDSSQDITVIERKNLTAERDNDPVETKTNNELSNDHIGNGSDENKNDKTELTNVHIKGKKENQSLNAKDRESGERSNDNKCVSREDGQIFSDDEDISSVNDPVSIQSLGFVRKKEEDSREDGEISWIDEQESVIYLGENRMNEEVLGTGEGKVGKNVEEEEEEEDILKQIDSCLEENLVQTLELRDKMFSENDFKSSTPKTQRVKTVRANQKTGEMFIVVRGGKVRELVEIVKKEVRQAVKPTKITALLWQNSISVLSDYEVSRIIKDVEEFIRQYPLCSW